MAVRGRGRFGAVGMTLLILALMAPAAAADTARPASPTPNTGPGSDAREVRGPGIVMSSTRLRSAPRRVVDPLAIARPIAELAQPARVLNPTIPAGQSGQSASPSAKADQLPAVGGSPAAGSSIDATIPTTTTLFVPGVPVEWPSQVHLEADVDPPPPTAGALNPAVMFSLNGDPWLPAPMDAGGHAVLDELLPIGSHEIAVSFGGQGDYEASASAPATVVVIQRPGLATQVAGPSAQSSHGFDGLSASTDQFSPDPSPGLAVGPEHIIQITSAGFRFFDRSGDPMYDVPLAPFFVEQDDAGLQAPQPQILYDDFHDRFIATEVAWGQLGHLLVAISSTADPTDFWWIYDFVDGTELGPANLSIGMSSNKIGIGLDMYSLEEMPVFRGGRVLVIDAASIVDGDNVITVDASAADGIQRSWRVAVGQSTGGPLHALGTSPGTMGNILHMTITGSAESGLIFAVETLTNNVIDLPGMGPQVFANVAAGPSSTYLLGLPLGPTAAIWQSGSLWFVSTRACVPDGQMVETACVRVSELSTGVTTSVVQDFVVNADGYSTYDGGIGITGAGDLILTFTRSEGLSVVPGTGSPLTLFAAVQKATDPPNSLREPALIEAGSGFFGLSVWSPTSPIVRDPLDAAALWQGGAINRTGGWRTWISRLSVAGASPNGALVLNEGRDHANTLRISVGGTLSTPNSTTRMRLSNSPTTVSGNLSKAKVFAISDRISWSLANPTTGGTSSTGNRTVYVQWGDGAGSWSSVESASLTINTPLGSSFVPLTPARLLDTRFGTGLTGRFSNGVPRSFQVTGHGGVPANAVAVTGNLTVTGQTRAGYVFLGPTAPAAPTSSTLNFPLGDTRANGVTVKLSGTGKLGAVFKGPSGSSTNLIFDVTGYFVVSDPNAPVGATWVPIEPLRVLDTRFGNGLSGRFANSVPRRFYVTGIGIPATATAVTGNVTVTGHTSAGYVFVGPTTGPNPTSSTINVPYGDNRANNTTVRLGVGGTLSAVWKGAPGSFSHLIFDVTGYFVEGPWGATYIALAPFRLIDTRTGTGLVGKFVDSGLRTFQVAGVGPIPATDTPGITANVTVTGQSSAGYVFIGPTASVNPTSSTLNFPKGDTRANGLAVALAFGDNLSAVFKGVPDATTDLVMDVTGYFR